MSTQTSIEWTDTTWNPVRGCALVSPGCTNCYAMRQAHRFSGPGRPYEGLTRLRAKGGPVWTGRARLVPEALAEPLSWRTPKRVFVNSMSDLFHEDLSNEEIAAVFGVMAAAPRHTFQVLTKRARRMREWFEWIAEERRDVFGWPIGPALHCKNKYAFQVADGDGNSVQPRAFFEEQPWPLPNVWLGVSVEDQQRADERIPDLLATPAAVRFLSCEPLLERVDLKRYLDVPEYAAPEYAAPELRDDLLAQHLLAEALRDGTGDGPRRLGWVIAGGESGPGARSCELAWLRAIVEQCRDAGVPCFVKQLGARPMFTPEHDGATGGFLRLADRKGGDPEEWPEDLRIREFPRAAR